MPDARVLALLRRTRALAPPPADDLADAELLARFLDRRDETAFEALVRRHGPMVRAVCRAALANPADADDAFQATFLVLVRRAAAIRDRSAVGGWLYRVAYRAARRLRRSAAGRVPLPDDLPARDAGPAGPDVRRALADEIARLPEKYRLAVQLCYVAGCTTADAARRLGWAKGTVLTRLAWARKRLRSQLQRRGVAAAIGSHALAAGKTATAVRPELLTNTVRAAVAAAAGDVLAGLVSDRTVTLTEGVVRAMTVNKLKWAAGALVVAAALAGVGVGRWSANTASAEPADGKRKPVDAEPDQPPPDRAARGEPVPAAEGKPGPDARPGDDEAKPARRAKEFVVTRPVGTWVREVAGVGRITLRFDEDRLYGTGEIAADGKRAIVIVEADYSFNKESTVYGVITSFECDLPDEGAELEALLPGQPFAFRVRADEASLTVKDLKALGFGFDKDTNNGLAEVFLAIAGRYVPADPQRAAPRPPARPAPRARNRSAAPAYEAPVPLAPTPNGVQPLPQSGVPVVPNNLPPPPGAAKASPQKKVYSAVVGPAAGAPPSDREVLQALPRAAARDDVAIVKNRIADETDPPRYYPLIGVARLNRSRWECKVYFTEVVRADEPFPTVTRKPRVEVVHLDQKQLVLDK
jgi:RNA polymerase sigma factor (sigma-70 family)